MIRYQHNTNPGSRSAVVRVGGGSPLFVGMASRWRHNVHPAMGTLGRDRGVVTLMGEIRGTILCRTA